MLIAGRNCSLNKDFTQDIIGAEMGNVTLKFLAAMSRKTEDKTAV